MKKNKILIGVISIMFAGIITLGIIECNNRNTKDNDKLFIGNGKFYQAKRLNGLGAIYDDDYIFFDCENQIYESYNYSNKKNDKKLNVNCRNSACSHSNDTCEAYVELGEYFVFNSKIYKYYNKSKVVSGENRLYGSIVEEESGKTVFKNSIPTDMSSELAIDDSEAILYVRVLSDDIVKVDGDRHAYLLDKNFNIIYCHYNIGKFPWGAILNGNYYYINDINEIVKVNLTTFESKSIASNGKAFMADNDENFIYYSNEFSELYKLSPDDESSIKIADNALFFSVQNKYIYASGGDNGNKIIYDKNGKIIADYSACVNMGADSAFQINDKIYTIFNGGVAYMDLDGKNYANYVQTECQFRYCGTAIPFLTVRSTAR